MTNIFKYNFYFNKAIKFFAISSITLTVTEFPNKSKISSDVK